MIAGRTNVSTNKRSLRYQWSKTSRFFQRKHYFILSRQASTQRNLLNLNLFFPPRWLRPRSRLSPPNPRFIHRRVQGILRSLFPIVSVIRSSGIPSFAKNLLARSITSGKSNRTPLSFYPLELYWTVFICLFSILRNSQLEYAFPSPSPSRFIPIFCSRPSFLCEVTRKRLYWFPEWAPDFFFRQ